MRRTIPLILALLLLFTACEIHAPDSDDGLSVVTTIFVPYDFVREISGGEVEATLLLPAGAESHSYEPTTQDIITIQDCDVFIYVGGESEAWVDGILDSFDTSNMQIIALLDIVSTVEEELVEGMQGEAEDEPELDEHVWTSPKNAIEIVAAITETLCAADTENAEEYKENSAQYTERLKDLDAQFLDAVDGAQRTTLVFADRFPFRYLADDYGLSYFAAFPGCSTEGDASAATVAFLIDKVAEEGIPIVFYIEMSNEKMADTICEATGAKKLLLHSCHNVTADELKRGVSYLELMRQNAKNLKEALN